MRLPDILAFTMTTLLRQRFRSAMLLLVMTMGVSSVVILTALGEGARLYVLGEFSFLGKDVLVVLPGKKETTGGMPPMMGTAARNITIEDMQVVEKMGVGIERISPLIIGTVEISFGSRVREAMTLGTTSSYMHIRKMEVSQGEILPDIPADESISICIIGEKIRDELFRMTNPIGQWLRVGDRRFRVIGVLAGRSDAGGFDMTEAIIIPVASARSLFNVDGLFRVIIQVREGYSMDRVKQQVTDIMRELHQGEEDITVVSPDSMMSTFNDVMNVMTLGVASIASISLLVAGILIMNMMMISVAQRTQEIGLLKALGSPSLQIRIFFLTEAMLMAFVGAVLGVIIGEAVVYAGRSMWPTVPFQAPLWSVFAAVFIAVGSGFVFSWVPAKHAAALEPVTALGKR